MAANDRPAKDKDSVSALTKVICWLAAFPPDAYGRVKTPSLRAKVQANAISVIVSPVVFTMALMIYGTALVGNSPYLYLLPVVVFALDRLLVAMSYTRTAGSGWLILIRALILLISLTMAFAAGLLSESKVLLKLIHDREDAATLQTHAGQNLLARIEVIEAKIRENEKALMERDAIEHERLDALRLYDLECRGRGGVDPKTGIHIKGGGKCGQNAATHQINAENAAARLEQLERIASENKDLDGQRVSLKKELATLISTKRSPADSVMSYWRGLKEAGFEVGVKIVLLALCVMSAEAFALIMSEVPVPEIHRLAVAYCEGVDKERLGVFREADAADIARVRQKIRSEAGDRLAPMEVSVDTPTTRDRMPERVPGDDKLVVEHDKTVH